MTIKTWVDIQKSNPWTSTTGAMLQEIDEHRRWHRANAPRIASLEVLLSHAQNEAVKGKEAIASLESERAANTVLTDEIDYLRAKVAELESNERAYTTTIGDRSYQEVADDLKRLSEKYDELIFAVGMKYPGETRHETALRYIRRMEEPKTTGMTKSH